LKLWKENYRTPNLQEKRYYVGRKMEKIGEKGIVAYFMTLPWNSSV